MANIDFIGFEESYVKAKLFKRVYEVTIDPPTDIYWKLSNTIFNKDNKEEIQERFEKLKILIIQLIVDSHYSNKPLFKRLGKFGDRRYLLNNFGINSLSNFTGQYMKAVNKRVEPKNVQRPRKK